MKCHYFASCVDHNNMGPDSIATLCQMINTARDITRRTFLQHVNREELAKLAKGFGYSEHYTQGLTMAGDWHISYHRSKYAGRTCYYFRYSSIEYIFTPKLKLEKGSAKHLVSLSKIS